jgi:ceramide glucosyltransferase
MSMAIEALTVLLTLAGVAYMLLALWGAHDFVRSVVRGGATDVRFAPSVSVLKPLKGVDPQMAAGLVSHCEQQYGGAYEIIFGVSALDDPAVAEVERLQLAYPEASIKLVLCPERLGTSGKVSNLMQMLPHASYDFLIINDSDIQVTPHYLRGVLQPFVDDAVGMVTAPYLGYTGRTTSLWGKLEALGISTDFMPGVLTARKLEHGIRFGLGSTLALRRTALEEAGGLGPLVDFLADDYELGRRVAQAGFTVALCGEVVQTSVPAYDLRGFWNHQMRWARSTRDSRRLGYIGLGVTYCVPWALATVVASGAPLWSLTLLSFALLTRVSVALVVGVGILRDDQVLRDLWLLPMRDLFGLVFWAWSYAGDTVVWRGEVFRLDRGRIAKV